MMDYYETFNKYISIKKKKIESHGGRSLVGYSPWGHKESDTTEQRHFHFQSTAGEMLVSYF